VTRLDLPDALRGEPIILLADRAADGRALAELTPKAGRYFAVVPAGFEKVEGLEQAAYLTDDLPLVPPPRAYRWIESSRVRTAVFLHPRRLASGRVLCALVRSGVRRAYFLEDEAGWCGHGAAGLLPRKLADSLAWRAERLFRARASSEPTPRGGRPGGTTRGGGSVSGARNRWPRTASSVTRSSITRRRSVPTGRSANS
jgi:hypothetical protein